MIQTSNVPNAAAIQDAATAVQKESKRAPGTTAKASCMTMAWPNTVASATATQPISGAELDQDGSHDHADEARHGGGGGRGATTS